jgi:hypothetical protein
LPIQPYLLVFNFNLHVPPIVVYCPHFLQLSVIESKHKCSISNVVNLHKHYVHSYSCSNINPLMPPEPFCGLWMTTSLPGRQKETIFHPLILGQLIRPVVHHIQLKNHHGRSFSFCKNEFCKNTDEYVVYFKICDYIC